MLSADIDDRLQAEVLLLVESHQFIVGLEGKLTATATQNNIVFLGEGGNVPAGTPF